MEPGYPDLASFAFCPAKLYLSKLWLGSDRATESEEAPDLFEAELVLASSCKHRKVSRPLLRALKAKGLQRPEMLRSHSLGLEGVDERVFHLSDLPRRGWNHGEDVEGMLAQIRERRPEDLKQQLARWVLDRVSVEQFCEPPRGATFGDTISHEFPLVREFKLRAEMVAVEWFSLVCGEPNRTNLHIVNLDLA